MALEIFDSLPSTMDAAREAVLADQLAESEAGWPEPEGILARTQTQGRGQRGRAWFMRAGESLSATYYVTQRAWGQADAGLLALAAGIAVAQSLTDTLASLADAGQTGHSEPQRESEAEPHARTAPWHSMPEVGLKWPNDVLLNKRKVSGILIERAIRPDGEWVALVGIGVNLSIREFPPEIAGSATSVWRETGTAPPLEPFAAHIARALHSVVNRFRGEGSASLLAPWRQWDATSGRRYKTEQNGATITGIALGLSDTGALRLRLDDGREIEVVSASSLRETE